MEKPLHERLRATESFGSSWCLNMEKVTPDIINTNRCYSKVCGECFAELSKALADEIESEYVTKAQHDSEVEDARQKACRQVMTSWALDHSMPMKDGECITEWLDRWTVMRPRFDDGEPVQAGDDTEWGYANYVVMNLHNGMYWLFDDYSDDMTDLPIKRPTQKVYDADGVEIKVGETVYAKLDGEQLTVKRTFIDSYCGGCFVPEGWNVSRVAKAFIHERPVFDADGELIREGGTVWTKAGIKREVAKVGTDPCEGMEEWDGSPWVMFANGSWMHAKDVTNREPDSIAKVRDDLQHAYDYGADGDIPGIIERLTALDERGA